VNDEVRDYLSTLSTLWRGIFEIVLSLDSGSEHFQQGLCCQGFATTAQVDNPVASRIFQQHPAFQWVDTGEARQLESVILHDLQSWGPV
jgi:hypothetical protein